MIKSPPPIPNLARVAALATLAFLSAPPAEAQTVSLSGSVDPGDIFIGFRQTGVANTLVANLGSVTQFLPVSLGGTWDGVSSFKVTFGLIPNTATIVDDLSADLVANFGLDWADNFADGSGVRWGVVGFTDNSLNNTPIPGYNLRTAFVTKARTDPNTPASALGSVSTNNFASEFFSFTSATGQGSYTTGNSTVNSTVAFIGDGSLANNWNTKIGATGTFGLGSGRVVEQLNSGAFQGPTNSVLDLWVAPTSGSTITTTRTWTGGSFTLNSAGELTYGAIPEPGTAGLLTVGSLLIGLARRRRPANPTLN